MMAGTECRRLRLAAGLTQEALARRVGVEPNTIARYERGELAISVMESDGRPCCLTLIRTEELADRVRDILGPAVNEIP